MVESWTTTLTFDIHSLVYPPAPPPVQEAPPRVGEVSAVIHSLVRRLVEERNDYDGNNPNAYENRSESTKVSSHREL